MERNTLTTMEALNIGDRFHLASDKKKEVWTKVIGETKITKFQTYRYWGLKDATRYPLAMKKDTKVIFLRHTSAMEQPATG